MPSRVRQSATIGLANQVIADFDVGASPEPHPAGRCDGPMSRLTLWNARGFARGCFRLADARISRAGLTAAATSADQLATFGAGTITRARDAGLPA